MFFFFFQPYRKPMILRIAGLPAPREDHARVSFVLRAAQHFDILRRVRDQGRLWILDPVRVLNQRERNNFNPVHVRTGERTPPLGKTRADSRTTTTSKSFIRSGERQLFVYIYIRRNSFFVNPSFVPLSSLSNLLHTEWRVDSTRRF